jgi:hypothetical protein
MLSPNEPCISDCLILLQVFSGQIFHINAKTPEFMTLFSIKNKYLTCGRWTEDGKQLAVAVGSWQWQLAVAVGSGSWQWQLAVAVAVAVGSSSSSWQWQWQWQ